MDLSELSLMRQREIEQLFAASLFIRPSETVLTCGWMEPEHLQHEQVRRYWELARERIAPTMDSMQAAEASVAAAMESDMLADVMRWSDDLPFMDVPNAYAAEIARRRYISEASILAAKLVGAIRDQDDAQVLALSQELAGLNTGKHTTAPDLYAIATRFEQAVSDGRRSINTGIPNLDRGTGGLERQTLSMIAGRPSMGKTALELQIARNVAQTHKMVDIYSMEMSAVSLWSRAACPMVGVTWRDVRAGMITDDQKAALIQASYDLAERYGESLMINDTRQTIDSLWRSVAERRPDLVIVDHLSLFRDKGENEVKRLGMITDRLKDISKSFDCAVLLAVQLSRGVESRTEKRPMLSDLRDSGEIEQNGDLVMMLYRDDYYNPPEIVKQESATELWIRKFRDGPLNTRIDLIFNTREEWFYPAERTQL